MRTSIITVLLVPFLFACSGKLESESDFRPYLVSWAMKNCGTNKAYQCDLAVGFAEDGFDGEDYVYGLYHAKNNEKRIVYVKIAARKPHDATVISDELAPPEK